ncbi:class I SAM-dependent methyltransferase [Candidatus Bathyarchaeota archaeon]|nr:class I SAM-dependent methyltransferase [Candidatus Bathyarchaeota archaeon]
MVNYGPASKYYDLFGYKDDIKFFRELALEHGKKALELGVGTARVAIELAKAGIEVWGIDNSTYMLNIARNKLLNEKMDEKQVNLILGDMRNFKTERFFPFVYLSSSTFEHCITEEEQRRCLTCIYKVLTNDGILAFDISNPNRDFTSTWYIDHKEIGNEEVVRTIFSKLNHETNTVFVNLFFDVYKEGKLTERFYESSEAKLTTKKELEKILSEQGFTIKEIYGDFNKTPFNEKSKQIIIVCSKILIF